MWHGVAQADKDQQELAHRRCRACSYVVLSDSSSHLKYIIIFFSQFMVVMRAYLLFLFKFLIV